MQAKQKKSPNDLGMGSLPKETLKKMELSKTNGIKKLFNHKSTPEITPAEQNEALKKEKAAKFKINLHEMRKSEDSRASTPQNYFSNFDDVRNLPPPASFREGYSSWKSIAQIVQAGPLKKGKKLPSLETKKSSQTNFSPSLLKKESSLSFYVKFDEQAILAQEKRLRTSRVKTKILTLVSHSIDMQTRIVDTTSTVILINRQKQEEVKRKMIRGKLKSEPFIERLLPEFEEEPSSSFKKSLVESHPEKEAKIKLRRKSDGSRRVGGFCLKTLKLEDLYKIPDKSERVLTKPNLSEERDGVGSLGLKDRHLNLRNQVRKVSLISTLGRQNKIFAQLPQCMEEILRVEEEKIGEESPENPKERDIFFRAKPYSKPKINPDHIIKKFKPKNIAFLNSLEESSLGIRGSFTRRANDAIVLEPKSTPRYKLGKKQGTDRIVIIGQDERLPRLRKRKESPFSIYYTEPPSNKSRKHALSLISQS